MRRAAAALGACAVSLALGDTIDVVASPNGPANNATTPATFVASVGYDPVNADQAELTVTIANTTPASVGGYLTGFGFRLPVEGAWLLVTLSRGSDPEFRLVADFNVEGLGRFDAGAALFGVFGEPPAIPADPRTGVASGDSATFVFELSGFAEAGLSSANFSAADLIDDAAFVVRFGGLNDGEAAIRGVRRGDPLLYTSPGASGAGSATAVPAPGATALGVLGLILAAFRTRNAG